MASEKGASSKSMDERLTGMRDSVLLEGEDIVVEEMGDQGQAIILTKSRVIIVKVGLTVTGELNGKKISTYPLDEIISVNVRKGPVGAVIQVCTGKEPPEIPSRPPDNVIIFTGPQKVKKCDAIAARISEAIGKPINKTEHIEKSEQPVVADNKVDEVASVSDEIPAAAEKPVTLAEAPKAGKERKSLAEEMFEELTQAQTRPQAKAPSAPVVETAAAEPPVAEPVSPTEVIHEPVEEEIEAEKPSPMPEFNPNPYLPKPIKRKSRTGKRVLALFGILASLVLAGIAVTSPMRMSVNAPSVDIDIAAITNNTSDLRKQCAVIDSYRAEIMKILQESNSAIASIRSGSISAAAASTALGVTDKSWRKLNALKAPAGLAGAKDSILSGLFIRKTALGSITSESHPLNAATVQGKFAEADSSIKKGLYAIDKMRSDLEKQIAANPKVK